MRLVSNWILSGTSSRHRRKSFDTILTLVCLSGRPSSRTIRCLSNTLIKSSLVVVSSLVANMIVSGLRQMLIVLSVWTPVDGPFHRFAIQYDSVKQEINYLLQKVILVILNGENSFYSRRARCPWWLRLRLVTTRLLQQFQIKALCFYQSHSVDMRYEDEQGPKSLKVQ